MDMIKMGIKRVNKNLFNKGTVTSGVAFVASFMLNGVPPIVCESVIHNMYSSVKKSASQLFSIGH